MILYFFGNVVLVFLYAALIMRVWTSWERLDHSNYKLHLRKNPQLITVIVIGRNEENTIAACLLSVAQNKYPQDRFEIIFVDDHSTDGTLSKAKSLSIPQLRIIQLKDLPFDHSMQSYKKAGLDLALKHANGEIVVCTDADCTVPDQWLRYIDFAMQQALIKMLVMPIRFTQKKSILNRFQSLDLMATAAFTGFGIQSKRFYSAHGANMAFRPELYIEMNIQSEYASGDDMFLVNEVARLYPESVKYLKSDKVIVETKAETTWSGLIQQRKRWATKSVAFAHLALARLQSGIFLFNLLIVVNICLGILVHPLVLFTAIFQCLVKGIMDYLLLSNMANFFEQRKALQLFLISFLLFTPYIIVMAWFALFGGKYLWKGRTVR